MIIPTPVPVPISPSGGGGKKLPEEASLALFWALSGVLIGLFIFCIIFSIKAFKEKDFLFGVIAVLLAPLPAALEVCLVFMQFGSK